MAGTAVVIGYGLYRRELLRLFVTWLLRFGLTPKSPSNSTNEKIYKGMTKTVPRDVTGAQHLWANSTSMELLAMKPHTAGMQRRCTTSRIRHHRDRHRKLSLSSSRLQ